jgi:hypothetical protein
MNSANGEALQSGASSTYQLTKADTGLRISCEVLASNAGGTGTARTTTLSAIAASEESSNVPSPITPSPVTPSVPTELPSLGAQAEAQTQGDHPAKTVVQHCVVPSLKGDSLSKARRALSKAHCKLGKVTTPRGSSRAALVVTHQRTAPGKKLPAGARVDVTLGRER